MDKIPARLKRRIDQKAILSPEERCRHAAHELLEVDLRVPEEQRVSLRIGAFREVYEVLTVNDLVTLVQPAAIGEESFASTHAHGTVNAKRKRGQSEIVNSKKHLVEPVLSESRVLNGESTGKTDRQDSALPEALAATKPANSLPSAGLLVNQSMPQTVLADKETRLAASSIARAKTQTASSVTAGASSEDDEDFSYFPSSVARPLPAAKKPFMKFASLAETSTGSFRSQANGSAFMPYKLVTEASQSSTSAAVHGLSAESSDPSADSSNPSGESVTRMPTNYQDDLLDDGTYPTSEMVTDQTHKGSVPVPYAQSVTHAGFRPGLSEKRIVAPEGTSLAAASDMHSKISDKQDQNPSAASPLPPGLPPSSTDHAVDQAISVSIGTSIRAEETVPPTTMPSTIELHPPAELPQRPDVRSPSTLSEDTPNILKLLHSKTTCTISDNAILLAQYRKLLEQLQVLGEEKIVVSLVRQETAVPEGKQVATMEKINEPSNADDLASVFAWVNDVDAQNTQLMVEIPRLEKTLVVRQQLIADIYDGMEELEREALQGWSELSRP
jgi:hypothetical protein